MLSVTPIPALNDNYIWLLRQDTSDSVCVVDPGDATAVIEWLEREGLTLGCILITHHHGDHTGGLAELIKRYSPRVIGPHNPDIEGIHERVGDGDEIRVMGRLFEVLEVPGHTLDHIAFFTAGIPPLLFCGDLLFSGGCGRVFEGTTEQMFHSLDRLTPLPEDALVFAAHEYTLANLAFARTVDPDNRDIREAEQECLRARELERPTLPSTLGRERRINPFLRCSNPAIRQAAAAQGQADTDAATFTTLRAWKDSF
ncbi:hydroxyacylglutathione hydrolase [Halomonas sp. 18H]|uniref:hydroxyacylglutathione hydrolase n=1 Tax=Halomonas almeriensis TaxID=308163 RepID=UPI00222FB639|nr:MULTISPECIES: hydroxyacylglutathione hydrolase [Halomonas]MCW4151926.1 hydroxyacylglutathione hydrolase [Halomonas sp. 18H]MDN3554161.1 hydroxyacylglutathione hydrolase [Halomonas almeriensis]